MLLLLNGCATGAVSDASTNPCRLLPVKQYSRADNRALADEMDAAKPAAIWPGVVSDYIALRDAVRACQSHP